MSQIIPSSGQREYYLVYSVKFRCLYCIHLNLNNSKVKYVSVLRTWHVVITNTNEVK